MDLQAHLKSFINKNNINSTIGIAFSGGRDSVVLAHSLKKVYSGKKLTIIYINHHLREDSEKEEQFVRKWSAEHEFPVKIYHLRKRIKNNLEEAARDFRYKCLLQWAREANAIVFTAHHLDDQIETLLYRIFRGTGVNGLNGIKVQRGEIYRPLLKISGDMIYNYAQENSLSWFEDPSNQNNRFSRNVIRHDILPGIIKHFGTEAKNNVSKIPHIFTDYFEYRQRIFEYLQKKALIKYNVGQIVVDKELISLYFPSFIKYFLESAIREVFGVDLLFNQKKWEEIEASFNKENAKVLFNQALILYTCPDKIVIQREAQLVTIAIELDKERKGRLSWLDWEIQWQVTSDFKKEESGPFLIQIDRQLVNNKILIANARSGQKIKKANNRFFSEIRKIYSDNKVPIANRYRIPLIIDAKDMEAVGGPYVGAADKYKVTSETKEILNIQFRSGAG